MQQFRSMTNYEKHERMWGIMKYRGMMPLTFQEYIREVEANYFDTALLLDSQINLDARIDCHPGWGRKYLETMMSIDHNLLGYQPKRTDDDKKGKFGRPTLKFLMLDGWRAIDTGFRAGIMGAPNEDRKEQELQDIRIEEID